MHPVAPEKKLFGENPRRIRSIDKPMAQRKEGTRRGRGQRSEQQPSRRELVETRKDPGRQPDGEREPSRPSGDEQAAGQRVAETGTERRPSIQESW